MKSRGYKLSILALCVVASSAYATGQNGGALSNNGMNSTNNATPPPGSQNVGIGVQAGAAAHAQAQQAQAVTVKTGKNTAKGGNAASKSNASTRNAGNSNVVIGGSSYEESRRPVNSAYAAGLVASPGTCLGSASGGVQGSAIGLSFGSTTRDDGCHLIRRMVVLDQLGMSDAALSLACLEDDNIREAMTRVGRSCTTGRVSATWNVQSVNPIVPVAPVVYYAPRQDRN